MCIDGILGCCVIVLFGVGFFVFVLIRQRE
jgi:hypothetical protein